MYSNKWAKIRKKASAIVSAVFILRWIIWALNAMKVLPPLWDALMATEAGHWMTGLPVWDKLEAVWETIYHWFGLPGLFVLAGIMLIYRVIHEIIYRRWPIPILPASPPPRAVRTFVRVISLESDTESVIDVQKLHQQTLSDGRTTLIYEPDGSVSLQLNGQKTELDSRWTEVGHYLLRVVTYDEKSYDHTR